MSEHTVLPYSYHTLIYPFTFENKVDRIDSECWVEQEIIDKILSNKVAENLSENPDIWQKYNEFNYFTPKARNAIFNTESGEHTSIHYDYDMKGKKLYYVATSDETQYKLYVKKITLSIFSRINIGMIVIELENYDYCKTDSGMGASWERLNAVCKINDTIRRLYCPEISEVDGKWDSFISTKSLCIIADGENLVGPVNLTEQAVRFLAEKNHGHYEDVDSEFISALLGKNVMDALGDIRSVLDDRMFVASVVRDDVVSNKVKENYREDQTPFYSENANTDTYNTEIDLYQKLYAYIFVDKHLGDCTCQDNVMLVDSLKEHVYTRWKNYGTIHGVTEYSMVCITGEANDLVGKVINPFLTMYVDMIKLALAQRAAINDIESRIVDVCKNINNDENESHIEKITDLWSQYIIFQNELFLPEVTFQLQGVELYKILKESLKIEYLNSHLENELDNLHEVSELKSSKIERHSDEKMNKALNSLGLLAIFSAISDGWQIVERMTCSAPNDADAVRTFSLDFSRFFEYCMNYPRMLANSIVVILIIILAFQAIRDKLKISCGDIKLLFSRIIHKLKWKK